MSEKYPKKGSHSDNKDNLEKWQLTSISLQQSTQYSKAGFKFLLRRSQRKKVKFSNKLTNEV